MEEQSKEKPGVGPNPVRKPRKPGKKGDPSQTPKPIPLEEPKERNKKPKNQNANR